MNPNTKKNNSTSLSIIKKQLSCQNDMFKVHRWRRWIAGGAFQQTNAKAYIMKVTLPTSNDEEETEDCW